MADDKEKEGKELEIAELHRKIKEAFEVFDHEANNAVDVSLVKRIYLHCLLQPIDAQFCEPDKRNRSFGVRHKFGVQENFVEEIGTIVRSLGCCPSEGELHELIVEVEEEEPTGYIRYEKFLPVMTSILLEKRYRPIPEDTLLQAFEVLDPAKRGYLSKEELIKYMTEEGEPFSQEEMEEMLSAAIHPESNSIYYKDYLTMMVVDEN